MKTLKKTLCLVLAVVMVVGVLIIPAGAADYDDFTDKDAIEHKEAVSVLTGLGIIEGTGSGFDPNGKLNRAAGAVLIARMLATPANAKNLPVTKPFDDVESAGYGWAAEGISYGVENGYISGHGNGKFDPAGPLTGYQLAKMLLVGIGYADASKYNGDGYETPVYVDAVKVGLFDDVADPTKGLTRDDAAQMMFVALTYTEEGNATGKYGVKDLDPASDKYKGEYDDMVFESLTEAMLFMKTMFPDAENSDFAVVPLTDYKGSFGDKTYNGLRPDPTSVDAFGRTTTKWVNGTAANPKTVAELTDDAAKVYTAKTTAATIKADFKGYTVAVDGGTLKVEAKNKSTDASTEIVFRNSDTANETLNLKPSTSNITVAEAIANLTNNSAAVYVYTSNKAITKIVVIDTFAGTVTDVDTETDEDGKTITTIAGKDGTEEEDTTVASGLQEGDIVLYTKSGADIQSVELAAQVTGTMKSYTSSNKYSINGKTYELADEVANETSVTDSIVKTYINKEMVYYIGRNNAIVFVDDVAGDNTVITDYAIVLQNNVDVDTQGEWYETAKKVYTVSVQVLKSDGTVGVYNVPLTKASTNLSDGSGDAVNKGDYYISINGTRYKIDETKEGTGNLTLDGVYTYVVSGNNITFRKELATISGTEEASGAVVGDLYEDTPISKKSAVVKVGSVENVVVNNSTVFILADDNGYAVKKGVSALADTTIKKDSTHDVVVVVNVTHPTTGDNTNVAKYVFATKTTFTATGATTNDEYVYVPSSYTYSNEDDKDIYTYEAIGSDGEKIKLTASEPVSAGIYKYKTNGTIDTENVPTTLKKDVEAGKVLDGVVFIGETAYQYSEENIVGTLKEGANICALVNETDKVVTILFVL